MIATAAGYAWFDDRPPGLSDAYCLTLARGLTPAEFLSRMGASPDSTYRALRQLVEPGMRLWDDDRLGNRLLIGVTAVTGTGGDWALGVEINGYLGVSEELIVPLSAGTRVVSHYRGGNASDRFCWAENSDIGLSFESAYASDPDGSTPDALTDVMREVGFDLSGEGNQSYSPAQLYLALAEYLTGVILTPEILQDATYQVGIVPAP